MRNVGKFAKYFGSAVTVSVLAACGGGGGGATTAVDLPTTTPPALITAYSTLAAKDIPMRCGKEPPTRKLVTPLKLNENMWYDQVASWSFDAFNWNSGWEGCVGTVITSANSVAAHWKYNYGNYGVTASTLPAPCNDPAYISSHPFCITKGGTTVAYGNIYDATKNKMPLSISNTTSLIDTWDIELNHSESGASDGGNISFDTFIGASATTKMDKARVEMMVHLDDWWQGSPAFPFTKNAPIVSIDGNDYYFTNNATEIPGWTGMNLVVFQSTKPFHKGSIDMMKFVDYLKQQGIVKSTDYIIDHTLSLELFEGKGEAFLKNWSVDVNK